MLISEYVHGLRLESGKSVRQFAKDYNISKAQISKYETGKCDNPSLLVAAKFCKTFGLSLDIFKSDFDYEDKKIKPAFDTIEVFKKRFGSEWTDTFGYEETVNFYRQYEKVSKLTGYEKCDHEKEYNSAKKDEVYIDRSGKCLAKDKNEIWICTFIRPIEFKSSPKNVNYNYMLSEISTVASLSSKDLGCKYYIFITSSKDAFNYLSSLNFHSYDTSAYVVYSDETQKYENIHKLYGKDFLKVDK